MAPARLDTDPAFIARVAAAREPAYGWADSPVGAVRYAVLPVQVSGDPRQGALVVLEFRDLQRREVTDAVRVLTLVGFGALAVAALASWLVAGRVLAPIRLVRQTAERIGSSDLTRRIEVAGNDDVAQLARTFNHMLDRLEQAFAAQRRFLDDAGHELRTPITVVRGHLELMGDDPADRRDTIALVTDELDRMSRIVDDLIVLAKAEQPDFLTLAPVDLADLTVEVVTKARALGPRRWTVARLAEVTVLADGQRLTQALIQLAANAVQHTGDGDSVAVGSAAESGRVRLWVADSGTGIAPEDRERIFERFARGQASARRSLPGAGLGLAIVAETATRHGGAAWVADAPDGGARFSLSVPAVAA
jgi:signal transduction histidine kinase